MADKKNWFTSMFSSESGAGDAVSASTMNVTKIVSILLALFAGITQGLAAIDTVSLSSGQMVTIWLTAAALVVLIGIADMVCRSYVTAKSAAAREEALTEPLSVEILADGERRSAQLLGVYDMGDLSLAHVRFTGESDTQYVALRDVHQHA
ncbi:MAG TPA: hypothetical protein VHO27_11130 [Angustibacter sp.]|nr:hypothetical protein [Angustibacter sp.]